MREMSLSHCMRKPTEMTSAKEGVDVVNEDEDDEEDDEEEEGRLREVGWVEMEESEESRSEDKS